MDLVSKKEILKVVDSLKVGAKKGSNEPQKSINPFNALISACYVKKLFLTDWFFVASPAQINKKIKDEDIKHFVNMNFLNYCFMPAGIDFFQVMGILPGAVYGLDSIMLDQELEEELVSVRLVPAQSLGMNKLIAQLLEISQDSKVINVGMGSGNFMTAAFSDCGYKSFVGFETNQDLATIAKIRASVLNWDIDIISHPESQTLPTSDKCFINYPLGFENTKEIEKLLGDADTAILSKCPKDLKADWMIAKAIIGSISKQGKGICAMSAHSITSQSDIEVKKFYLETGLIEAVIELPDNLMKGATSSLYLVVFSHNNETVKMLDAKKYVKTSGTRNALDENGVMQIVELYKSGSNNANGDIALVKPAEIADHDYKLQPSLYVKHTVQVEGGCELCNIADVFRGPSVPKYELESLVSEEDTRYKYVTLQNIVDGCIEQSLTSLNEIPEKCNKQILKDNDILISKIGPNFKIAQYKKNSEKKATETGTEETTGTEEPTGIEEETAIASENLYVIRLKPGITLDSTFIKMYLESEEGEAQLNQLCIESVMYSLPIKGLRKLQLPLQKIEQNNSLIEQYKEYENLLIQYKDKISDIKLKMRNLL